MSVTEPGITAPAEQAILVTPSDSADLQFANGQPFIARGISVEVSGNLKVTFRGGSTVVIPGLVAGVIHPISVVRVFSTGTAATGIVAYH